MHGSRIYLSLLAAFLIAPAFSQESPAALTDPAPPLAQVLISSVKDPFRIGYGSILKALDVRQETLRLAPDATQRWMTLSKDGTPLVRAGLIAIVGTNGQIAIPQDSDGKFELPLTVPALESDIELRINAKRGELIFVPLVETRGVGVFKRRLGDLRLECEMTWRLEYGDASMMAKAALRLMGSPCRSKHVSVPTYAGRKLKSATLVRDGKVTELKLSGRSMAYFAPLYDEALDNDVLITLNFMDAEF